MKKPSEEIKLFLAYSREDKEILDKLNTRLKILKRAQLIDQIWYDELISPGKDWNKEIKIALDSADIIILLLSDTFLASDYCYNEEMKKAIEYHEQKQKVVIPIIAKHCMWKLTPVKKIQVLPNNGQPLIDSKWGTEDLPYHHVTEELTTLLGIIKKEKRKKIKYFYYSERVEKGINLFREDKWQSAIEQFNEALTFFELGFTPSKKEVNDKIKNCKKEIKFKKYYDQGRDSYNKYNYKIALNFLQQAYSLKEDGQLMKLINSTKDEIEKNDLKEKESVFFRHLNHGNSKLNSKHWDEASHNYQTAFHIFDKRFNYSKDELLQKLIEANKQRCEVALKKVKRYFEKIEQGEGENRKTLYVTKWEFDSVKHISKNIIVANHHKKYGFLVNGNRLITDFIYDDVGSVEKELAVIKKDGKFGIIDISNGIEVTPIKFDYLEKLHEELRVAKLNDKFGFVDKYGNTQIPFEFEEARRFGQKLAAVKMNGQWGFIDNKNKLKISYQYDDVLKSRRKLFSFFRPNENLGYFSKNKVKVKLGDEEFFIDKNGNRIS